MTDGQKINVGEIPTAKYTLMVPGCGIFEIELTAEGRREFVRGLLEQGHVEIAGHVVFATGLVLASGTQGLIQQVPAGVKLAR